MGLDMYLDARLYLSEYSRDGQKKAFEKLNTLKLPGVNIPKPYNDNFKSFQLEVPLMYWRKANQIHNWFVNNVQDGRDECQTSDVEIEQLRDLDKLCSEVFMARSEELAAEKLPPSEGFFFGGTDIDEGYWEDLRTTMEATHKLLADYDAGKLEGWEFLYRASW